MKIGVKLKHLNLRDGLKIPVSGEKLINFFDVNVIQLFLLRTNIFNNWNISDKSNALVIAGLNLANKSLNQKESSSNKNSDINLSKLIEKIDKALEK